MIIECKTCGAFTTLDKLCRNCVHKYRKQETYLNKAYHLNDMYASDLIQLVIEARQQRDIYKCLYKKELHKKLEVDNKSKAIKNIMRKLSREI